MANAISSVKESEQNLMIQGRLDKKAAQKRLVGMIIPYLGLAFTFVFFTFITKGRFLSPVNIENLINQSFGLVIVAVGATFVYAHAGKDMSIGAAAGCGQLVCALLIRAGHPIWVGIAACILVTMIAASLVAGISLGLNVPVFIGSMCVRTSFLGILQYITLKDTIIIDYQKYSFMNSVPVKAVILIVFIAIGFYLFNFTAFGKCNKALGGNEVTAIQAGVKKKKMIFWAFMFLGFCVGVSAVFSVFRMGKVSGTSGAGLEFNIMIAMALGAIPMDGGDKTRLSSAIIGAVTISFLVNGLQVWGLDPMMINGVKGLLFVIIIALSYDRSSGKLVT